MLSENPPFFELNSDIQLDRCYELSFMPNSLLHQFMIKYLVQINH